MTSNYDKQPYIVIEEVNKSCISGWENIATKLSELISEKKDILIAIECYHGVDIKEIENSLTSYISNPRWIASSEIFKNEDEIRRNGFSRCYR